MFYQCWLCKNDVENSDGKHYQIHFVEGILTDTEHTHITLEEVTVCKTCFDRAIKDPVGIHKQVEEDIKERDNIDLSQWDVVLKIEDNTEYGSDIFTIGRILKILRKDFGGVNTCMVASCRGKYNTFLCYRKKNKEPK